MAHIKIKRFNEWMNVVRKYSIYIVGSQIRADLHFLKSKRVRRDSDKKIFKICEEVVYYSIHKDTTSNEIFETLKQRLEELNKTHKLLRNRHIDTNTFLTIGKFVDWKELVLSLRR